MPRRPRRCCPRSRSTFALATVAGGGQRRALSEGAGKADVV